MKKWQVGGMSAIVLLIGLLVWVVSSYVVVIPSVVYVYRVELETPGGPLPFRLHYFKRDNKGDWIANIDNWQLMMDETEQIPVEMIGSASDHFEIRFPHYDSFLSFEPGTDEADLVGEWVKFRGDGSRAILNARAFRPVKELFDPIEDVGQPAAFTGQWSVDFESSDELAIGTFTVDENQLATGTFLTTTGDYRYLAGRVDGDLMRLSTFDGAHAFLFHARMQDDGTIEGDFWSGNWWHETWTAVRDDNATLPDAFEQSVITDEQALADAVFKDLEGVPTRVLDVLDESNAKARVIEIFGSWCPNCSDAGRELVSLKEHYGDDLAIVGLAFELTEDFDRSVTQVKRHHAHIGSDWPILIAGLNDKDKATQTLGFLDQVHSYPTLVFLNKNNEVQAVYSGFSGPATGDAYKAQRERFETLIESMIE